MYLNSISFYRIGKFFSRHNIPILPRIFEGLIFLIFNSYIPTKCEIGPGTVCGHRGIGVVIHEDSIIGKNVLIRSHVVIGGSGVKDGVAVVCDGAELGAGAKIIGKVSIGYNAIVGANAVVLNDVPDNVTVVGNPAKIVRKNIII
jgi:serine O-acetyltransferase